MNLPPGAGRALEESLTYLDNAVLAVRRAEDTEATKAALVQLWSEVHRTYELVRSAEAATRNAALAKPELARSFA